MTDPDTVAAALARLARGTARHPADAPIDDPEPARVVAAAEASMERLSHAAAFVDAGGESRLRRAIRRADAAGDDGLAARGRTVLETLDALRAAAGGDEDEGDHGARTTSTPLAQRSSGEGA